MTTYSDWSGSLSFDQIRTLFLDQGCKRVVLKELSSRQDNDKNQIYLGTDFSAISQLPTGEIEISQTQSSKPRAAGKLKFHAPIELFWLSEFGAVLAPNSKAIYYPQYPEVRLSGFLSGSTGGPSDLLARAKRGQESGRILLMGVSGDSVFGLVLAGDALARNQILGASVTAESVNAKGALRMWDLSGFSAGDSRALLLDELERIHAMGWVSGRRIRNGETIDYNAQNGGGYTLEALLGI